MSEIKKRVSGAVFAPKRLELLTDGVFAIAMTLLVLEITLPEIIAQPSLLAEMPRKLLELWPKLYHYAISFITLGILWAYHHLTFHCIKRSDMALVWLNIVFLMFVALIPLATSIQVWGSQQVLVIQVINLLNVALPVAMLLIIWTYATGKHRLVDSNISPRFVKVYKLTFIGFLLLFMLAIGISFINLRISPLVSLITMLAGIVMLFKMPGMLHQ
jgi:uncharacterized membrane protein